jgi:chitinase
MINRLRSLFAGASKNYLITGAPGCFAPDQTMGAMIAATKFDILFIQYYGNAMCSARRYIDTAIGFSWDNWVKILVGTASANAKLYIGLPGDKSGAYSLNETYWLDPSEAAYLISVFGCHPSFGGVMLWDATGAKNTITDGVSYDTQMKNILVSQASRPCIAPTKTIAAVNPTMTVISYDGTCGPLKTCAGSMFGNCCSQVS